MDVCGAGMGNMGVFMVDYLLVFYYNLVLMVVYCKNDLFGILLFSIGLWVEDKDELFKMIDDL